MEGREGERGGRREEREEREEERGGRRERKRGRERGEEDATIHTFGYVPAFLRTCQTPSRITTKGLERFKM